MSMVGKNDVNQKKKFIWSCVGKEVYVTINQGRKKSKIKKGVIVSTYPDIFTVVFENDYNSIRTASYSYNELLTDAIKIKLVESTEQIEVS